MVIAYIVTGKAWAALSIGGIEVFTKIILYYFHERAWQLVPRGKVRGMIERKKGEEPNH